MSEPGCCSSFCGGIWNKIKEGKVKTSARMIAFIAVVGMLACSIAVGLSTDCSVSPGIIGMVTSLFLIICEVRIRTYTLYCPFFLCFCPFTCVQLPFLFGCIPACVACADKMGFIMQNFIFKGTMFIGLSVVRCFSPLYQRAPAFPHHLTCAAMCGMCFLV